MKPQKGMFFSFIVPVYNAEKYLSYCIESLLKQTYRDFEIVLVDDGSADGSGTICDEYSNSNEKIHVIHQENCGVVVARQNGVKAAKGNYLLFVDSDDFVREDLLQILAGCLRDNSFPDIVLFDCLRVSRSGTEQSALKNKVTPGVYEGVDLDRLKKKLLYDERIRGLNFGSLLFSLWCKCIRKPLFDRTIEVIPERIRFGEDLILTKRLLDDKECRKVLYLEYAGYLYRDNPDSVLNTKDLSSLGDYEKTVEVLDRLFSEDSNKVCVFSFFALVAVLYSISQQAESYREFLYFWKLSYEYEAIWQHATEVKCKKKSPKDFMKILVIRFKLSRCFYRYFRKKN